MYAQPCGLENLTLSSKSISKNLKVEASKHGEGGLTAAVCLDILG